MTEFVTTQWLALGAVSIVIWFMKRTIDRAEDRIKSTEDDIQTIKLDYLHKNEFKEFKMEIRSMFEEIKTDIRSLHKPV
mgnify:CR=1 FL=1